MSKDEILVVGAGPVGLTMAAELARHGAKCRIIDKNKTHAADSRAVGIHARTMEVFEDMGIVDYPLKHGIKVKDINLFSHGKRLIHGHVEGLDSRYNYILDMPQSLTEPMLINHLKSFGVEVERGTELTDITNQDNSVEVSMNGKTEHFAYVIGCDGASSSCRQLLDISFPGSEYPSSWAVLDAKLAWPYPSNGVYIFFGEDGICGTFPLPSDRMRITCELSEQIEVSYESMQAILQKRIGSPIELHDPRDLSTFVLHHRQASSYRIGRVFLAGDAAHIHSPAGGQGMNTGIQDAYNLAWKLALVQKGIANEDLLSSYHEERHPIGEEVLKLTDTLTRVVTTKNWMLSLLRKTLFGLINHIPSLKSQMPKRLSQLSLKYPKSRFIQSHCKHEPKHIRAGMRAPDHAYICSKTKTKGRLFEFFKGTHFSLLIFCGKEPVNESEINPKEYFYYIEGDIPIRTLTLSVDDNQALYDHYGVNKPTAYLIRPDGYIGLSTYS